VELRFDVFPFFFDSSRALLSLEPKGVDDELGFKWEWEREEEVEL
jgi:hypothetical protein